MPTNYPSGFDVFPSHGALMSDAPTHDDAHVDLEDAIAAIQAALGLNPQGSAGTVAGRLLRRDWAGLESALPTGAVEGQLAWTTDTRRLWVRTNSEWRIVGGNIPRCSRSVLSASINIASGSWVTINMSTQTTAVTGVEFVSGSTVVIPAGLGGDYHLDFGLTWGSATVASPDPGENAYRASQVLISNNASVGAELSAVMASTPHNNEPGVTPSCSASRDLRLEAGATLTWQASQNYGSSLQPQRGWFNLHQIAHAPALT